LEWMTNSENKNTPTTRIKPNTKKITQYSLSMEKRIQFTKEASDVLNIPRKSIGRCCRNTQRQQEILYLNFQKKMKD
jgi:hypothetical protein